jgi:hypothetical protein
MISNTRSGQEYLAPDAAGRGGINLRPERLPEPFRRGSPAIPSKATARGPHLSLGAARNQLRPVLYPTRRSPAGPKLDQPKVTSGYGAARIHGLRMIGNGETAFHAANLAMFAGFSTGSDRPVPHRGKTAAILNATCPVKDHPHA